MSIRPKDNAAESATAWFAVLESARLKNDFERAAEATRQLRRLGVKVQFTNGPHSKSSRSAKHGDAKP
jgi:hypothetical protein